MLSAAIWSAVTGMALTYAEPPRSFELIGQKVRDPGHIAGEGLATCLDTSLLIAAALEATGLNPAVIFKSGHAFVGVWLKDMTFSTVVESDVVELRKAIAAREFIAFETTLVTSRPPAGFDHAVENGRAQLSEAHEVDFDRAIDISRTCAKTNRFAVLFAFIRELLACLQNHSRPKKKNPFGRLEGVNMKNIIAVY